jgi:hypothetical protein
VSGLPEPSVRHVTKAEPMIAEPQNDADEPEIADETENEDAEPINLVSM